jgi:hypothetical protein
MPQIQATTGGIDWMTATARVEEQEAEFWHLACDHAILRVAREGHLRNQRVLQGYYGFSAGNCFAGGRSDGYLVQMTGIYADRYFTEIYRPFLHTSRIDIQVTVKYDIMPTNIAKMAYLEAERHNENFSHNRRRKLLLMTGSDGGDTCYIGSSSSEQRARIYNKEVQSEDPQYRRTWRYEVVFKNDLAVAVCKTVPIAPETRGPWAAALVVNWLKIRGVDAHLPQPAVQATLPLAPARSTDVERRLTWLETQVAPTVRWLTEQGYGSTIASLFGFRSPE